jgi:hypothetical protein
LDVKKAMGTRAAVLACAVAIALGPVAASADEKAMYNEAGVGALAALSSLVYGPAKILYAGCGLLFGGIAWALSGGDQAVMQAVLTTSVRGDYVVTPEHLRMERPLEFLGRDPAYRETPAAGVASADVTRQDYPPAVAAPAPNSYSNGY